MRSDLEHLGQNIKEITKKNEEILKEVKDEAKSNLKDMKLDFERFINEIKNDLIQNKKENYNSLNE